jgi:DNA-binding transcriptional LysR family regulator
VVRHGPIQAKRVIVKVLATSTRLLVASPGYLKRWGQPSSLEDLKQHKGIIYSYRGATDWRFKVGRRYIAVQPHTALCLNNGLLMREAAIQGIGIALLATFILEAPLRDRTLRVIDVGAQAEGAALYIGYPDHLRGSAKIRALTAWLQSAFGDPPHWEQSRS